MISSPTPLLNHPFKAETRCQIFACLLCFAFGLAMILNSMAAADGTWFWYGVLFQHGERLYSHLHLVQQPFFILDTVAFMDLAGKGWLASKLQPIVHLAVYVSGFAVLARYLPLPDRQKAILIAAAFFASVNAVACRFDDYHVVAESLAVYSVVLLLELHRSNSIRRSLGIAALLGVLAALSFETRINNGAALFLASAIAIVCLATTRRWASIAVLSGAAVATAVLVVLLTGDSLHNYWLYSFVKAATIKGGSGSVLMSPLRLPWNTAQFLENHKYAFIAASFLFLCFVWAYVLQPALLKETKRRFLRASIGVLLISIPLLTLRGHPIGGGEVLLSIATIATFLLYGAGVIVVLRWLAMTFHSALRSEHWNGLEALLFVPLGQLASDSMSAGGRHGEAYAPMALFILLLPIASPIRLRGRGRTFLLAGAFIIASCGLVQRVIVPYRWLDYYSKPMFVGRQWYRHPLYGPMYIERDLLTFVEPICERITPDGGKEELLSTPYAFANYFCGAPPWHDYVQTWYDTSSKDTVEDLIGELQQAPPKWVLYERQPAVLALHETVYDRGHPIPHRLFDRFLEQKINNGSWQVVSTSTYASTSAMPQEWFLLQTRP